VFKNPENADMARKISFQAKSYIFNLHEMFKNSGSEPKFLKILKCNSAESVSAGFQFNCFDIFNDKTLNYRHLDHFLLFSGLLKFIQKNLFYQQIKTIACTNPVVLSDL
jgi:hypothetical protein